MAWKFRKVRISRKKKGYARKKRVNLWKLTSRRGRKRKRA